MLLFMHCGFAYIFLSGKAEDVSGLLNYYLNPDKKKRPCESGGCSTYYLSPKLNLNETIASEFFHKLNCIKAAHDY